MGQKEETEEKQERNNFAKGSIVVNYIKAGCAYDFGPADQCALQHCRPPLYWAAKG